MQWLIDIINEQMAAYLGVPPCYYDRGVYVDPDWTHATLDIDNAWHELDLSGIVDADAKAVAIRIVCSALQVGTTINMRPHGLAISPNTCVHQTQVANIGLHQMPIIGLSADLKIDYKVEPADNLVIAFVIRGWWK